MHLSLNWLREHVDLEGIDARAVAHELTMRTALVEGLVDQAAAIAGVVVGEVVEHGPHPNADRLSLCAVSTGDGEPARVVCGAPNVAAGQRILYAPVGTSLPIGLKLKKAKIRGEPSFGMICAEDELGLGPEHDGIIVLPEDAPVGLPAGELPGLTDVVLEIDNKSVTHRPDLWGHRGFARELAAIFGRELRPLELATDLAAGEDGPSIALEEGAACPLYAGLCVEAAPRRSPDALRWRLAACGMRPLNLLVDLSNYVMLELGQPTHPFDRERLRGDAVVVRPAREGERMTTLDGVARALGPDDTVIADGEGAVAIAGVMGGEESEVADDTRRVFLESASFEPTAVRRTASRLGLRTDASARFEKGLDPALVERALRRYAHLLRAHAGDATVATTFRAAGAAAAPEVRIPLSPAMVRARLGMEIDDAEIARHLESIGFGVTAGGDPWDVAVPSWRATRDVTLPEDLVEEVGRLAGYDRVADATPRGPLIVGARDPVLATEDRLRDALAGRAGFAEVMAYSFVEDRALQATGADDGRGLLRLANAQRADATRLRPSTVPGLLARVPDWLRQEEEVRAFEVGRGYRDEGGAVAESREVAALIARRAPRGDDLVRALKGVARQAAEALDLDEPAARRLEGGAPWLHPVRSAALQLGEARVGVLGELAPDVADRLDIEGAVGLLVLDAAALAGLEATRPRYRPVPRFPPVRMDLAFVLDYGTTVDDLVETIRAAGPRTLARVEPFDVYRGAPLADDERSVAVHLEFQAPDRTLRDEDVRSARDRIVAAVGERGGRLR